MKNLVKKIQKCRAARRVLSILFFITFFAGACTNDTKDSESEVQYNDNPPEISFETTEHNFEKVYEGEKIGWFFQFENTGGSNLIITNATASCGCTVPEYDRKPVPPGKKGKIKVIFDTSGREGLQVKTVRIESNAQTLLTKLTLKAEVVRN